MRYFCTNLRTYQSAHTKAPNKNADKPIPKTALSVSSFTDLGITTLSITADHPTIIVIKNVLIRYVFYEEVFVCDC